MRKVKMVIAKGRIFESIIGLLNDAGIQVQANDRLYVPLLSDPEIEAKIMKPQNIAQLIELGSHDIGFTGHDWIVETRAKIVEVMDLGLDPVQIVAAVPADFSEQKLRGKTVVVASEYENISKKYLRDSHYAHYLLRTFGATEAFPPDDADMIVDNTATGQTLRGHGLKIIATILESSTRFIANRAAMDDAKKREKIEELKMLFTAVLDARQRVMLEMNVPADKLETLVRILPCMRAPTVSALYGEQGYAVKAAVPRSDTVKLIPQLKKIGATDILEYEFRKVIV